MGEKDALAAEELRDMGILCYHNQHFDKALEYFQFYLQLAPHAPDARLVRQNVAQLKQWLGES